MRHTPDWAANVQSARKHGIEIRGYCTRCEGRWVQDLDMLAMFRGKSYHWSGRRDPCPLPGCTGDVFYLAFGGTAWPWPLSLCAPYDEQPSIRK